MKVLILEDDARLREELAEYLRGEGVVVLEADRPSAAHRTMAEQIIDVALVDVRLPEYDGLRFLAEIKKKYPGTEVIIMSGHGDMDDVIKALRLGAFDYLRKPFTPSEIEAAIIRTGRYLEVSRERFRLGRVCDALRDQIAVEGDTRIVGDSQSMRVLLDLLSRAASQSSSPVLIVGESGTGKELVARRIHEASVRAGGPFIAVNCAAVTGDLFESEFFGHERGAFTDAKSERPGFFRRANGGTLFLDEIGELNLAHQSKLLRVIEEGRVRRVGSDIDEPVDIRVLSATNRPIDELLNGKSLRGDLYYRLAVIEIHVPPLRERRDDIPALVDHFLELLARKMGKARLSLPREWMESIQSYEFPGNARELRNMVERAVILGTSGVAGTAVRIKPDSLVRSIPEQTLNLEVLEESAVRSAMLKAGGNQRAAARLLGISRQALERRLLRISSKTPLG